MANAETSQFPSVVVDHVYGEPLAQWYERFFDELQLLGVQRDAIDEAVWKVYTRASTLDGFFGELEDLFGTPERAATIGIPILGNDFLKIEDYLGVDIPAYIKHLGGDPSQFVKEIPVADVVRGVMSELSIALVDPGLVKRLETASTLYLMGIRDGLETKDVLTRSAKVGGVGLDAAMADRIAGVLEEKLRALRQAGVVLRRETERPLGASTFHLVKPAKSGLMQPEDEDEIEQLRTVVPGDVIGDKIRSAIDRVLQKTGARFKNEDVSHRFRTAIASRLRDIRDYRETLDLLTKPSTQGGFGIPEPMAKKVLVVVEGEVRVLHGKPTPPAPPLPKGSGGKNVFSPSHWEGERPVPAGASGGGVGSSAPPPNAVMPLPTPTTAITPQLVHPLPPRPVPPPPPPIPGPKSVSPLPKRILIARPAPVPPSTSKPPPPPVIARSRSEEAIPSTSVLGLPRSPADSLAMTAEKEVAPRPVAPPPPIVKRIPIAPPSLQSQALSPKPQVASPPPPLSQAPTPTRSPSQGEGEKRREMVPPPPSVIRAPSVVTGKPRLQDIRPVPPRLVGPIEELQRLTIQDFRKIAKVSAEAAARIGEKLALLEKDSYTKRAEGVKALRGSALMAMYAETVNAAFLAKRKIDDLIPERLQTDKSALTLDEFRALMGLNQQLRF